MSCISLSFTLSPEPHPQLHRWASHGPTTSTSMAQAQMRCLNFHRLRLARTLALIRTRTHTSALTRARTRTCSHTHIHPHPHLLVPSLTGCGLVPSNAPTPTTAPSPSPPRHPHPLQKAVYPTRWPRCRSPALILARETHRRCKGRHCRPTSELGGVCAAAT